MLATDWRELMNTADVYVAAWGVIWIDLCMRPRASDTGWIGGCPGKIKFISKFRCTTPVKILAETYSW